MMSGLQVQASGAWPVRFCVAPFESVTVAVYCAVRPTAGAVPLTATAVTVGHRGRGVGAVGVGERPPPQAAATPTKRKNGSTRARRIESLSAVFTATDPALILRVVNATISRLRMRKCARKQLAPGVLTDGALTWPVALAAEMSAVIADRGARCSRSDCRSAGPR